ncbi:hypothetical protein NL676_029249 [Syzygium grande]|nr:hypothetical protein NL676_029249 [Syzygium grande]
MWNSRRDLGFKFLLGVCRVILMEERDWNRKGMKKKKSSCRSRRTFSGYCFFVNACMEEEPPIVRELPATCRGVNGFGVGVVGARGTRGGWFREFLHGKGGVG